VEDGHGRRACGLEVQAGLKKAKDLGGLLLLYTANGNVTGARELADIALAEGKNNIAFAALFQLGTIGGVHGYS